MVLNTYSNLLASTFLHARVKKVVEYKQQYRIDIGPIKDLPDKYLKTLVIFKFFLNQAVKGHPNAAGRWLGAFYRSLATRRR
jgi:hypothetical protein